MPQNSKKILVVDDSRAINEVIVSNLKQELDIDIASAFNMVDAIALVEAEPDAFFLAILDLNLPDAPNGEIVDYVMSKGIGSIVLTSNTNEETQSLFLNKGIIEFAHKGNQNEVRNIIECARRLLENMDRKALVVDDSDVARMLIVALLKKQNLTVLEAIDGKQALRILDRNPDISLVVTDYNMPKMDGMEFINQARKTHPRDELAIIGVSATNDNIVSVKLLKSGANDFIARPFSHEEFNCRINQNIDALANIKRLKDSTIKDFLTQLYNRKYIFEAGTKLFNNAKRDNIKLTTAMIDIDFFKKVNDNYGHHRGDLALKHVSNIITRELRDGDILARMGGEEFCILCINLDAENALMVLERVRKAVEDSPLVTDDLTIPITISIGYNPTLAESLDQMINKADEALYQAKETGRNKVVIAQ